MAGNAENKLTTLREAVSAHVREGDCVALGGFATNRRAYALVREVIRQGIGGLYIEGGAAGGDVDMLIGAGCVRAMIVSYIANLGYTMVCRRFREAVERGEVLFDDYSLDVHTIAYHAAALGLPYVPVKNMLGSDLVERWGIPEAERRRHDKLPDKKFVIGENPFRAGDTLCLVPAPRIDVALIHVQKASPGGICRIEGPQFQDVDIAVAARRTIVSCEELVDDDELRREPAQNTLPGLCVDAVVHLPYGAHPSQCHGYHDYDSRVLWEYDEASRTADGFARFIEKYVTGCGEHGDYLDRVGASHLASLRVDRKYGYVSGLRRGRPAAAGEGGSR